MRRTTITLLICWCLAIPQKAYEKKNFAPNKDNFEKADSAAVASPHTATHATEEHPGEPTHKTTTKATPEKGPSSEGPERCLGAK